MASVPQEYKRDVRACERLWSSVSTYLRGMGLYGSNYDGDLENSFSTLYKAWDQLWQADRTSLHGYINGYFLKPGGYIFGLTDYMNAVEKNIPKGESLDQYLHFLLNRSLYPKEFKDTLVETDDAQAPKGYGVDDPFMKYDYRLATPFFRQIHHKQHPAIINLLLLKTIRNYDQHDRIEESTKSNSVLITAMNPYITANAFNYYEAYIDVYLRVKADCVTHCKGRPKCHSTALPQPSKVLTDIKIPMSLPHAQLLSGEFSSKGINVNHNKPKEPINYRMLAEQTSLGWKIAEAIKKHDSLFSDSSKDSEASLFKAIWNVNLFADAVDNVSYKAYYKASKDPREVDKRTALDKIEKAVSAESFLAIKSAANNLKFPYIVKFYERNDSSGFDEIDTKLIRTAIQAYKYESLSKVVDYINKDSDFSFIINLHTIKNALTILENDDAKEFATIKMNLFGKDRYHVKIINYIKRYSTESEYRKICKNPQRKVQP